MTIDVANVNEALKGKRLEAVSAQIDSERGVYELRLDFEEGRFLELAPDGFGLAISGGQEYVGTAAVTDEQAWEMAERMNAQAPEGVRYEMRRTERPTFPQRKPPPQLELGESAEPVTPWYVARVKSAA